MIRKQIKKLNVEKFKRYLDRYKIKHIYFSKNRQDVKKGVFIGVFFALLPIPSQIVVVLLLTLLIRFNIIVALSIVLLTNPITMPFVLALEYNLGSWITGDTFTLEIDFSMDWIWEHFSEIVVPLYVGAFSFAIVFSSIAYYLLEFCWIRSVKRELQQRKK